MVLGATAVAFVVFYYGPQLAHEQRARKLLITPFAISFFAGAVAGLFGAFINKTAPTI